MKTIDITVQKNILSKFPDIFFYPEYTFKKDVLDFLFNFAQSDGHVGVLFGLPGTGKKTFLRQIAAKTPNSVIIHIQKDELYTNEVEKIIEKFVFNDYQHIFIENITNVIDFQLLMHDIRKEYAHNCSFVVTGDSPYAFYIASLTSLLFSIVCFPTYTIYKIDNIKEYIDTAIFKNIYKGLEIRNDDGIESDFKYICDLYKNNKLDLEIQKILRNDKNIENKQKILELFVHSSICTYSKNNEFVFAYSQLKDIINKYVN